MITSLFHDWERRLASVSKDRVVRPFEWGEDWLTSNGHHGHDAQARVHRWVTEVMTDTRAFFDAPAIQRYMRFLDGFYAQNGVDIGPHQIAWNWYKEIPRGKHEALWARIERASFLSPDEKRAAVGYGPAGSSS